jgi:hypothetical protein
MSFVCHTIEKTRLVSSIDNLHLLFVGVCIIIKKILLPSIGNLNVLLVSIPVRK